MSYLRQPPLFSFEQFDDFDDDNFRLGLVVLALEDSRLLRWLDQQRAGRRNKYPQEMLWRCYIAKFIYQIGTYAELIRELRRNGSLRRLVGIHSSERVPEAWHFSRFVKRLSELEGQLLQDEMFHALVERLRVAIPNFGRHLALDGTAVKAHTNQRRSKSSDPDAAWGVRQSCDKGGGERETKNWLGYLVHLVVDCDTELPVGFEVTPANCNESPRMIPMLETLAAAHPEVVERTEAVLADKGYDSAANCEHVVRRMDAQAIIKMRRTLEGDAICPTALCHCTELGTPVCLGGHKMVAWGRDGDYLKWRCPVVMGKAEVCDVPGGCSASDYGAVYKQRLAEDYRRWPGIARESAKFDRLYNRRGAVERVNSRLKDHLLLDDLTVRGKAKVRVHVMGSLLVMLAGAVAMAEGGMLERVRQTVRLAA
jgi:transposase